MTYYLGRLEATRGERERAARHFADALAACEAMGARPRAALCRMRLEEVS